MASTLICLLTFGVVLQVVSGEDLLPSQEGSVKHGVVRRGLSRGGGGVEISVTCTQRCGGEGDAAHRISVAPLGHPGNCQQVCNVTSVRRSPKGQ